MPIKDFYNERELKPGDVIIATIKVMVDYTGHYRIYRCEYPVNDLMSEDDLPQGHTLQMTHKAACSVFPILQTTKGPDPFA